MPYFFFIWDEETVEHLAEHDVTPDDFESIVLRPARRGYSRTSGRPTAIGRADDGRYLYCVYEMVDEETVRPVTAFEIQADDKRRFPRR